MSHPAPKPDVVPHGTDLPPPRPGVRHVRVPWLGIVIATDGLRSRVDRFFHWPMIVLALAVLPLLVIELRLPPASEDPLALAVAIGFAIIWFAFLVEFVVKIAIAESRVEYVRRNWLDVVIILIPLLRPLRPATAAVRAGRAARAGGVLRTTRVFKLRGVGMKLARYLFTFIIGMEATDRLRTRVGLKRRVRGKDPEKMTRHELMTDVRRLRVVRARWEQWHEDHERYVDTHGGACYVAPKPETPAAGDVDVTEPRAGGGTERDRAEPRPGAVPDAPAS